MRVKAFVKFVTERHMIAVNRAKGLPKPWTTDIILQSYRFCNVYRELDTVTQWIRQHWSTEFRASPEVWFAMVVARLVNQPSTLNRLQPVPWVPREFIRVLNAQASLGVVVFNSAYIVSTNGRAMSKPQYLADHVLTPMWERREALRPTQDDTLGSYHARLMEMQGMGSFMAAQVVADLKNTKGNVLRFAVDWWIWASPGPGSLRGMSRVYGEAPSKTGHRYPQWIRDVNYLRDAVNETFTMLGWDKLCAQDVQNCLCEFDKYERVRLGEGRPKSRYQGTT